MIAACIPLWNLLAALFHKSIFGADGYTYMSFPISLRAMMIGKAVTANFWIMSAGMILIIGLIVNMKVSMADYTDMNAGTLYLVNIMESLEDYREASPPYDCGELASMAVKVVLLPFLLLGQSILFCAVFQAGAVLNHVLNPKRNRYGMTAAIIAAGTVFLIAFRKTADGISAAAAGSGYPTAGLLADMLLRAAGII